MDELAMEKIKVLITSNREETAKNCKRLLEFEPDIEAIVLLQDENETQPVQQASIAAGFVPDVIVVTNESTDENWIKKLTVRYRSADIIVVVYQTTGEIFTHLKSLGLSEFLSFPVSADEMVNTIRSLHQ